MANITQIPILVIRNNTQNAPLPSNAVANATQQLGNNTTVIVQQQSDWIANIFNNPLFWILLIIIALIFLVGKITGRNKQDPATKPWYGEIMRGDKIKKDFKNRFKSWGMPVGYTLTYGVSKVGKINKIEYINKWEFREIKIRDPKDPKKDKLERIPTNEMKQTLNIQYRLFGFIPWLKARFGYGFLYFLCEEKAVAIDKKIVRIDPRAFIINDGDIWRVSTEYTGQLVDDFFQKKEIENWKGHVADIPRRLANLKESHAMDTGKLTHESELREKERLARHGSYTGGK